MGQNESFLKIISVIFFFIHTDVCSSVQKILFNHYWMFDYSLFWLICNSSNQLVVLHGGESIFIVNQWMNNWLKTVLIRNNLTVLTGSCNWHALLQVAQKIKPNKTVICHIIQHNLNLIICNIYQYRCDCFGRIWRLLPFKFSNTDKSHGRRYTSQWKLAAVYFTLM